MRVYEAGVYFDYPDALYGERHTRTYRVRAGSTASALRVVQRLAKRDQDGRYVPRVTSLTEIGKLDA